MSNVISNDTDASTGIMNLTPVGGTPLHRWFSCCFPKNWGPEHKERSSPNLPESHHVAKGLTPVAEETQSGILREHSDANVPNLQRDEAGSSELPDLDGDGDLDGQPDFTPQPSFSSSSNDGKNNVQVVSNSSVVNEFWKMVISIFFLTWMKKSNQTKKLENGGTSDSPAAAAAAASVSSSVDDSDSVPVMSFSPEK